MPGPAGDPFEMAADWLVRHDRGPLSAKEQAAFDAFLEVPENAAAYAQARQLWAESGQVARRAARTKRRRGQLAAVAAIGVLAAFVAPSLWLRLEADIIAGPAQVRDVALPDGSHARLAAGSALSVDYETGVRRLRLVKGEAEFIVAADPDRPFVVEAAGGQVRALGTIFLVERQEGRAVRVTGVEHSIQVSHLGAIARLAPGQSVTYGARGGVAIGPVTPADREAGDWLRGVLVFQDRPLGEAADELARWRGAPLIVMDPGLRRRPINGVFRISDRKATLSALRAASSLDLKAVELPGGMLLITRR